MRFIVPTFHRSIFVGSLSVGIASAIAFGEQPPAISGAQFDVVSIKPHQYDPAAGGGMRILPDGTFMMSSQPIGSLIGAVSPDPVTVRDIVGLPDWAISDAYDIIAKPPPGSNPTREQRAEMLRNMFIERMKLVAHVEEQERPGFALVFVRTDHRLGPKLVPSALDCSATPGPCGFRGGQGLAEAKGLPFERLVLWLRGPAGGQIIDRTGLTGLYDWSLRFAPPRLSASAPADDDAPQVFTAVQEQLGLKLVGEKTKVKIFVIDHIERPTPD